MIRKSFILLIMAILTLSCEMKEKADLILYNGEVYTVDSLFSKCTAIAVKHGIIVATGEDEEILNNYRSDKYIDLRGGFLYPGFNDAHCHFISLGEGLTTCDLRGAGSFEEVLARLKEFSEEKPVTYILGEGWDQNLWKDNTFPTNEKLNELFPKTPVILTRIDFHAVIANNAAIDRVGLKPGDPSIPPGEAIVKNGHFTGVFLENTAEQFKNSIPKPKGKSLEKVIMTAEQECFKNGLTSISDAEESLSRILSIDTLYTNGKLKIRSDVWMTASEENMTRFKAPYKNGRLRVGTLKLYIDGALGSRGALLKYPYSDDPSTSGIRIGSEAVFTKECAWALEHGFQVATHCIGDLANHEALRVYGSLLKSKNDLRWRIEHAQVVDPADINLFGKYSIIPSIQPTHATSDMFWADERLGGRLKNAYAYKALLSQLGWLPSGTDFPIEKVSPIYTFFAAVYRKNLEFEPDSGFQTENALTKEEALKSMTIWAARASFEEHVKGSIEKGKYADFVLLDRDIMTAEDYEIPSTRVLMTIVGGEVVYSLLP